MDAALLQILKHLCYYKAAGSPSFQLCPAAVMHEGDCIALSLKNRDDCTFMLQREQEQQCRKHVVPAVKYLVDEITASNSVGVVVPSPVHDAPVTSAAPIIRSAADSVLDRAFAESET